MHPKTDLVKNAPAAVIKLVASPVARSSRQEGMSGSSHASAGTAGAIQVARRRPDGPWHAYSALPRSNTLRSLSGPQPTPLVLGLALVAGLHMAGAVATRHSAAFAVTHCAGARMLPAGLPVARVCPRLALRARQPEGAGEQPRPRARRSPTEGTTFVATEYGELVEVGCINAKHDFIIGEHMLGRLPEHAPPGQPLGTVTLVGAGPGDPELLTVAAYKALQAADVVVADRLVSQEILELVQGDLKVARKLPVQILPSALYSTVALFSMYTMALTSENFLPGLRARGAARNLPVVRRGRAGGQERGAP